MAKLSNYQFFTAISFLFSIFNFYFYCHYSLCAEIGIKGHFQWWSYILCLFSLPYTFPLPLSTLLYPSISYFSQIYTYMYIYVYIYFPIYMEINSICSHKYILSNVELPVSIYRKISKKNLLNFGRGPKWRNRGRSLEADLFLPHSRSIIQKKKQKTQN